MAATYEQPRDVDKRVRFFDGQFLKDQDFVDEQHYHVDRQRRHNRTLHVSGITEGLVVTASTGSPTVAVSPGVAIDPDGRQLVLLDQPEAERTVDLADHLGRTINLYLIYREIESDQQAEGSANFTRWQERPLLEVVDIENPKEFDTPPVLLARVELNAQGVEQIHSSVREYSGLRLPGPVGSQTPTLRMSSQGYTSLTGSLVVEQKLGVGTTPEGRLHVVHTNQNVHGGALIIGPTNQANLRFGHHQDYSWIQAHGNKPLVINSAGNSVAIGTDTPAPGARLQVSGGNVRIDGNQQIVFADADTSNNLKLQLWSGYGLGINNGTLFYAANGLHSWRDSGGANERMRLTTTANGGLTVHGTGTSSFAGRLAVGSASTNAGLEVTATNWNRHLVLTNTGGGGVGPGIFFNAQKRDWCIIGTNATAGAGDEKLGFFDATANSYRMVIDKHGRLGLGETSPGEKLQVKGGKIRLDGNQKIYFTDADTSNNLKLQLWSGYGLGINGGTLFYAANGIHSWRDSGGANERMRLTTADNGFLQMRGKGGIEIYVNDGDSKLRFHDPGSAWYSMGIDQSDGRKFKINYGGNIGDSAHFTMTTNGLVGLGTTNPSRGKLEIRGNGVTQTVSGYAYLNRQRASTWSGNGRIGYGIWSDGRMAASEFNAFSDIRTKRVLGTSDSVSDLETLQQIKITDYEYQDPLINGVGRHKKVIGQQVAEVFPQAVTADVCEVVPDIMQASEVRAGWVQLKGTGLDTGDRVSLVLHDRHEVFEVLEVSMDGFRVALDDDTSVFVYGREVNDFHVVDYEALAMLNISATQELVRRLHKQQSRLDAYQHDHERLRRHLAFRETASNDTFDCKRSASPSSSVNGDTES